MKTVIKTLTIILTLITTDSLGQTTDNFIPIEEFDREIQILFY